MSDFTYVDPSEHRPRVHPSLLVDAPKDSGVKQAYAALPKTKAAARRDQKRLDERIARGNG